MRSCSFQWFAMEARRGYRDYAERHGLGQRIREVLVLASTKPMTCHHYATAKTLVIAVKLGEGPTLIGRNELCDGGGAARVQISCDAVTVEGLFHPSDSADSPVRETSNSCSSGYAHEQSGGVASGHATRDRRRHLRHLGRGVVAEHVVVRDSHSGEVRNARRIASLRHCKPSCRCLAAGPTAK